MKTLAIASLLVLLGSSLPAKAYVFGDVSVAHCKNTSGFLELNRRTNRVSAKLEAGSFSNTVGNRLDPVTASMNGLNLTLSAKVQSLDGNHFGTVSIAANGWESIALRRVLTVVFKSSEGRVYGAPMDCVLETK